MKEANGKSKKGMPDKETYEVNFYAPTGQEWIEHFTLGLERLATDYNQHKVANNLASALKGAMATVMGLNKEKPSEKRLAKATELVRRMKAGETFDLREFVSKDTTVADKGASDEEVIEFILENWDASEKKVVFLAFYNLPSVLDAGTAEEVVAAFKARKKATDYKSLLK